MKLKYLLAASVVSLAATTTIATPAFAQETTSSVRGDVVDQNGTPIAGATVTVTHVPSGTTSTQTTDADGGFNAAGLRLGGPFTVTVVADGYESAEQDIGFLSAGQAQRISVALADAGQTIVVTGARTRSSISLSTGAATTLTARDIAGVSNINRDIRNLAARDPLVTLDSTNNNAISIAGQNNRFNRFTVDGVAFGDPFGLESGGLVSARGPVPLDAIGEFSVEIAPVDIQQGFFQGGAINTQLKSGGNAFTFLGGAYYQDDSLRGDRARNLTRTGAFESQIYTAQVTGPIIKDKLFFAVTYERTRDTVPADVLPSQLGITDADLTQISDIAQTVYGFDTLGVADSIVEKDDKLVTKLDWNVADGHRVSATYIWNDSSLLAGQTGVGAINADNPTYSLLSNNYTQGAVNHFGILQSNNQWSDSFSTQLRVSYADYVRLQVPVGGNRSFGQFLVCLDPTNPAAPADGSAPRECSDGQQQLQFGPDVSRQANELDTQSLAIEFQATLKLNNHSVKLIAERRRQDVRNLFAQRVSGAWLFDSVADLQAQRANEVDIAVPLLGGIDTVTADFQNNSWTFGIMDTIDVTDTLTVVAGMRYDLFDTPDRPFNNVNFLERFGFPNTGTLNGRDLFQPRFGVNWQPTDRLTLRGSAGLFGGGSPNVWISNSFSNPGPTLGRVQVRRVPGVGGAPDTYTVSGLSGLSAAQQNAIGEATLNNVTGGTGVPQALFDAVRNQGTAASPTNALDPNFEVPSQWRFSGSVDYEANLGPLGDGWNLGVDVIYSRVKDALEWTDLRSVDSGTETPDGRPRYQILPGFSGTNTDLLLTNTGYGESWNIVGRFDKVWNSGFFLNGSYTYQDVTDQNPGTSSVAFSNYTNTAVGFDPNFAAQGISNYQRDHQFRLGTGFDGELFGDNNTRVELFYNVRSGQRYSYTMFDPTNGRSAVFGVTGRGSRNLLYVPNVSSQTADANVIYDSTATFEAVQALVQGSELNAYQGQIAPKNIGKTPWVHKLDLSLRQEVPIPFGGKIELLADVENVLNLIDKDWGTVRQVGFPYTASVVSVACVASATEPCAQYRYSSFRAPNEATNINGSLWGVRFGVRVKF
ncbi:carboxypeptidase regulatory-like domain-containing protein [Porphyrobacter sp. YT40]|uniref:TonB-dependent receptor n=1 Tax=Porphyrobacter sp. YT40 TaxID=2547601 RepID=UPI00114389C8|nr:carboxypeptidase regulatory-like domain-containing protein [Porphyrobacter sp. YT40]QDH33092.1 TonB-dependent receptor [Porphyrobacter sp. YT40]